MVNMVNPIPAEACLHCDYEHVAILALAFHSVALELELHLKLFNCTRSLFKLSLRPTGTEVSRSA